MKPKALMLSVAVLLGSAAVAFAQTYSEPPQTPAGPTSPQPGTTARQQNMNDNAPAGSKSTMGGPRSTTTQSNQTVKQAQSQALNTRKQRVMASSRRHEGQRVERDPATTALNLLEENGYRDFSNFRRTGRDFEVTADQNGRSVNIVVDPVAKTVRPQG